LKKNVDNLYNSVPNGGEKDYFIFRASSMNDLNKSVDSLILQDVIESMQNHKKGNSSGPNGLHMESFIYGGLKLYIHLSLLFTSFVHHCYLPNVFLLCFLCVTFSISLVVLSEINVIHLSIYLD